MAHDRRSVRIKGYDYSQSGAYFVTICTRNKECLFGEIVNGEMLLNDAGRIVQATWDALPNRFPDLELDAFIVMPNHVHGIIIINCRGESRIRPEGHNEPKSGDHKDRPYGTAAGSLGRIIQAFKSVVTHEYVMGVKQHGWAPYHKRLWQRNYYEHVIRNGGDLNQIREYVSLNPPQWETDEENPTNLPFLACKRLTDSDKGDKYIALSKRQILCIFIFVWNRILEER